MESLLVNLIDRLARELPWARTVDEDYGQLEALDDENFDMYPLTFPAILIDLPGTEWSDAGDWTQRGVCEVRVRLAIDGANYATGRKKKSPAHIVAGLSGIGRGGVDTHPLEVLYV